MESTGDKTMSSKMIPEMVEYTESVSIVPSTIFIAVPGTRAWFVTVNGKKVLHREDGPAIEMPNGDFAWFWMGELHRDENDGPAMAWCLNPDRKEWPMRIQEYIFHGKTQRKNGPAFILEPPVIATEHTQHAFGKTMEIDFRNGHIHSDKGPAVRWFDGERHVSVGHWMSKEDWQKTTFKRHEAIFEESAA